MLKIFSSFLIIFFSFIMYFINHPLSMGILLLIQTLLTCLISGIFLKTYWFSYILFLTFLGGLLVLFIYVTSIASNELFQFSFKLKISFIYLILNLIFSIMLMYNIKWMIMFFNSDMLDFFYYFMFFNNENKINLSNLYNNHFFFLTCMLIIYLFITLISIVKITNIFYGPLRSN